MYYSKLLCINLYFPSWNELILLGGSYMLARMHLYYYYYYYYYGEKVFCRNRWEKKVGNNSYWIYVHFGDSRCISLLWIKMRGFLVSVGEILKQNTIWKGHFKIKHHYFDNCSYLFLVSFFSYSSTPFIILLPVFSSSHPNPQPQLVSHAEEQY